MENSGEKIITDKKVIYLVRTLSKTNKKDYENYVVNAIWNRLENDKIEIVTQQYIYNPNRKEDTKDSKDVNKHYFIDLYFPSLNIGIECNEAFHKKQIEADKKRETNIKKSLEEQQELKLQEAAMYGTLNQKQIDYKKYKSIPIDVTQTYEEVERQINNAVHEIKEKIKEEKAKNAFDDWQILNAEDYYKDKDEITTNDKVGFKSIKQACNILFATGYIETSKGRTKTCFTPRREIFLKSKYKDYMVWFPPLAIRDENNELIAATKTGWKNQLIKNGKEIIQNKDNEKLLGSKHDLKKRIVFAKFKDPLGDKGYKFVGIFELEKDYKGGEQHYHRIGDKCKILKR